MDSKTLIVGVIIGLLIGAVVGFSASFSGNMGQSSTLQGQITSLQGQLSVLQAQVDPLRTEADKVSGLQQQITTLTSEKTSLQNQINTLTSEKTTLQSQLSGKDSQISTLQSQISELQSQIDSLKSQLPALPPSEGEPGSSRFFPQTLGQPVTVAYTWNKNSYTGIITVKSIIRGQQAWDLIYDENQFNDPPLTGYEYVMVKIRFELRSAPTAETTYEIDSQTFVAVSGGGRIYSYVFVVEPKPEIESTLYQGGFIEGWDVFLIEKTDQSPLMSFGVHSDGTGGVWFKLY